MIDVESIVYDLGIEVLRETDEELWALCPGHFDRTGKPDHNPAWSVNRTTGAHHCFSCGYSGSLSDLYRDVSGTVPEDLEWELQKASVQAGLERVKKAEVEEGPAINEWQLNHFAEVPQRLLDRRRVTRGAVDAFGVRWDKDRRMWVLPIRTTEGVLVGYQFRQKGGFSNHPKGLEKSRYLFGISHQLNEPVMTITEAPLDAVRMAGLGIPCISTMGAWVDEKQAQVLSRHYSMVVNALDNPAVDAAGKQGSERLLRLLHGRGTVLLDFDYTGLTGKDPGDEPDDSKLLDAWDRTVSLHLGAPLVQD
jgi:DNA primase